MKKLLFLLPAVLLFASCDGEKDDASALVGIWETYWMPPQPPSSSPYKDISQMLVLERGGRGMYIIKSLNVVSMEVIELEYPITKWYVAPDNVIFVTGIAADGRTYILTRGEYIVSKDRLAIFFDPSDSWTMGMVSGAPFNRVY